jgi:sarcosine oxidase subunit gamma
MTDPSQRRHGLEPLLFGTKEDRRAGIELRIRHDLGHVNLRGNPDDLRLMSAVEAVLGQPLPTKPNTFIDGERRIYWLGPDEWLVLAPATKTNAFCGALEQALEGMHAAINLQDGGQLAIELSGPGCRDVFARGCTLDFHPAVFQPGTCAQSGLAKASVLIGCLDTEVFEIVVRRSFSEYLLRWLAHSAGEYGVNISAVQSPG